MKVFKKAGARRLFMMVPFVLLVIFVIALSGPISSGGAYAPGVPIPPPGPFPAAPTPPAFDSYVDRAELDGILANGANQGNVHIMDVRSSFEYLADVCPMQTALGMPTYDVTNVGHPVWNWGAAAPNNVATPGPTYEEAYSNPYWIGFYFAGNGMDPNNIRMIENPNFHDYTQSLVMDGSIDMTDTIIVMCQTGYRASYAAMELKAMGFSDVRVFYGSMLAWNDDWDTDVACLDPASDPDGNGCDPDNTPGPAARASSQLLAAPWKYDTARLTAIGATAYWNGSEPHVAVKPQWLPAGDFMLSYQVNGSLWASYADYLAGVLSVNVGIKNNAPVDVTPAWTGGGAPSTILPFPFNMNYASSCTGYGAVGSGCEPVAQSAHGNAYNAMVVHATATNGVSMNGGPVMVGTIAPNATGTATVKYNVPPGVVFFKTTPYAIATDVPDPTATWPSGYNDPFHTPMMAPIFGTSAAPWPATGMGWYGVYQYPGPVPTV
ncbi:MAG: rhodanese-like domain-containing protein [Thermoleophilia bacterium]|jgi:rhodanese-related sulfurtransferase